MAASAAWSLQESIYLALTTDAPLTALLGGANVFDDVPQDVSFPYVTLAQSEARDWSTGTEDGSEHIVTVQVWSRAGGKKDVQGIVQAIKDVLHDADLALTDHRLINLRQELSEARLEADGETYRATLRYRAVTEPTT